MTFNSLTYGILNPVLALFENTTSYATVSMDAIKN